MPDLNSLPPSSPSSFNHTMSSSSNSNSDSPAIPINVAAAQAQQRGETGPPSPRGSISLQAAATVNAGLQHEPSRRSSNSSSIIRNRGSSTSNRRRSQVLMNIQLNDPTVPAPGEMVGDNQSSTQRAIEPLPLPHSPLLMAHSPLLAGRDPHHSRAPSLGELHQELEAEQEAQVNRLLGMIRQQQLQLQQLQVQRPSDSSTSTEQAITESDRSAPTSAHPTPPATTTPNPIANLPPIFGLPPHPRSPSYPRSSFDMARADITNRRSRTPSRGASPRVRSTSISDSGEQYVLTGRDEGAFYQAETQMLTRENQMLRHRIRDLERQLSEMTPASPTVPHVPHEPSFHSHLTHSTSVSEEASGVRASLPTVADSGKEE